MTLYETKVETDSVFTGIVQQRAQVAAIHPNDFGAALIIDPCGWDHQPAVGDSIAVNGCCLTFAEPAHGSFRFDVIQQTLAVTTLGSLRKGDAVNLEHAVTPSTMLGGHVVQGHVDGIGTVSAIVADASQHRVRIAASPDLMVCIVDRGSIAVDGVSLTVAEVGDDWFEVALIPTTLRLTTLGMLRAGDTLNLETDYIAKVVVRYLQMMNLRSLTTQP